MCVCSTRTDECVRVKKTEVKAASVIKSSALCLSTSLPHPPKCPSSLCNSCWFWKGLDLFKLKGKQHEGSLMWRSGGGAKRRGGGWRLHPAAGHGHGHGTVTMTVAGSGVQPPTPTSPFCSTTTAPHEGTFMLLSFEFKEVQTLPEPAAVTQGRRAFWGVGEGRG